MYTRVYCVCVFLFSKAKEAARFVRFVAEANEPETKEHGKALKKRICAEVRTIDRRSTGRGGGGRRLVDSKHDP